MTFHSHSLDPRPQKLKHFTGVLFLSNEITSVDADSWQTNRVIATISGIPEAVRYAAEQIRDDMEALHNDEKHIAFLMAVDCQSGKAKLLPIPTLENVTKLKEQVGKLPEGIQDAILNNIPKKASEAIDAIWAYLKDSEELPEKAEAPSCERAIIDNAGE